MKLVLKQDVNGLGGIGDVVEVKEGYGRNYLLPRGMAELMGKANMREIDARKRQAAAAAEQRQREVAAIAEQLADASCTIAAKANEEGHLFGSVSARQIVDALAAEGFARVDAEMVELAEPIRQLGVYEVPVQLSADYKVTCKVWVVQE